jgi:Spy/CpxP family protein refolding chaperone
MKRHLILLSFAFASALSWGQSPQTSSPQLSDDPIAGQLFPPELVMQYRQEINLTADQSKSLRDEVQKAQAKFLDMQFDMQGEKEKLVLLLKARPVDEKAVLAQLDKVLDRERDIKKTQISLLIQIKNQLTADQQSKLAELRRKP